MKKKIHLNSARLLLDTGDAVDLDVWTKDGGIMHLHGCVGLKNHYHKGTRQVKILASGQIRQIRDVLIFGINGMEVFL